VALATVLVTIRPRDEEDSICFIKTRPKRQKERDSVGIRRFELRNSIECGTASKGGEFRERAYLEGRETSRNAERGFNQPTVQLEGEKFRRLLRVGGKGKTV